MRGKRGPSKEPVTARMHVVRRTGRALHCGRCGQRLPTLTYRSLARVPEYMRQEQRDNGGLSPNGLYIDWREMAGWRFDGETLRPTDDLRERYQRAREKVRTTLRAETKPTRLKLAGRAPHGKGLLPGEERQRQGGDVGFPPMRPAPERIECLQCGVENLIELIPQSAVK